MLSGAISNEQFPTLVDRARATDPEEELVIGGQKGSYPGNQVHDLETALDAVREFWATGRFKNRSTTEGTWIRSNCWWA